MMKYVMDEMHFTGQTYQTLTGIRRNNAVAAPLDMPSYMSEYTSYEFLLWFQPGT